MTVIVIPSTGREVDHAGMSAAAAWGSSDWIVPNNVDIAASDMGLTGAPLNAAAISTSGLDVSIDTFEAYLGGALVASDDNTAAEHTYTLAGGSTTTTLYLGYDHSATDTIIFGPAGDFNSADPKVPVGDVTDDGSSATNTLDRRPVGYVDRPGTRIDSTYTDNTSGGLTLDTGTISDPFPIYEVHIYRVSHTTGANYMDMRVNGSSATSYQLDFYDADKNTFSSQDNTAQWGKIAGTDQTSNAYGGVAVQTIRIALPPELASNSQHWPVMEATKRGVGKNVDFPVEGSFASSVTAVDQIEVLDSDDSTGVIEVFGLGYSYGE